jgi:hypothetical protein
VKVTEAGVAVTNITNADFSNDTIIFGGSYLFNLSASDDADGLLKRSNTNGIRKTNSSR